MYINKNGESSLIDPIAMLSASMISAGDQGVVALEVYQVWGDVEISAVRPPRVGVVPAEGSASPKTPAKKLRSAGSGSCIDSFGCDGGYEGGSWNGPVSARHGDGAGGGDIDKREGLIESDQPPILLGNLSKAEVDGVIKQHTAALRYCYQRELQKDASLHGKVIVKFTIAKDGTVSAASTPVTTLSSPAVEQCLVGRFLRMSFPAPRGAGVVFVSYPFLFSSR